MKVTSYIAHFLKSKNIDTIFELQGGMITRIIDELYRHDGFKIITMHHEQAAAMAADAYARVTNKPGVALATSGPGATNLITGIGNCYFDSVPAIFITGQVNLNEQKGDKSVRQLGFQETDIVSVVKPLTKAAFAIKSAQEVPAVLQQAYDLSLEGRPGPVLIDIPMNLQIAECDEFKDLSETVQQPDLNNLFSFVSDYISSLRQSKRPLVLAGRGIRIANAVKELHLIAEKLNIPIVTSLNGIDVIPDNNPCRIGLIGSYGNRWANYALGTCDLLLVIGSRLDLRQTGSDIQAFKTGKKIFHVDIDAAELNNRISDCQVLHADILPFLNQLLNSDIADTDFSYWFAEIKAKKEERPDTAELSNIKGINPNKLVRAISHCSRLAVAVTADVGSNQMWVAQSVSLSNNQLFLSSGGMGAMGYSLPAAIGSSIASGKAPVVCFAGDGGFQINVQELQTIRRNNLPIKIVILNNHCLGMIRQFQDSYFDSAYQSTVWGYSAPDFAALANVYEIESIRIDQEEQIEEALLKMWGKPDQPFLLDVSLDIHTNVYPKMLFGNSITEMEPKYDL
ncbi:thiamine pyrophosphate-binding protein [Paludibacter sp.]|uniref:thiamine pyrophosphate-binding protein n=1 Tax=Paludibacter sp. TaxID=1898105 RepID=UPI001352D4C6|nr:thiamine pyrophosphate-binding protein [Paludibacter sp.]MTK52804.1 thiamine pyrophosphate-binding protein [Paludibacter sp.]